MIKSFMINNIPFTISKGFIVCLVPIHLDVETSNNHAEDPRDLITWISSIQVEFNGYYYLLRTPEQLIEFYKVIYKNLQMEPKDGDKLPKKVITFIHNSSYDLSYLWKSEIFVCYHSEIKEFLTEVGKRKREFKS